MLVEKEFDKPYPEPPECEVNDRDCEFDVDAVCHECGAPLCEACAIGVRHQPQLVKYEYTERTETDRTQLHCPDCLPGHELDRRVLALGGGGVVLGALLLYLVGLGSPAGAVVAVASLVAGAALLRHEYRLKVPQNDNYSIADVW